MMMRIITISYLLLCATSLNAQDRISNAIRQADSLFEAKKFTESFEIYQHMVEQERLMSPAMLLKMAFIKEGLGDYTNALYYLNLYYLQTADKRTLTKMEELAEKRALTGYQFNDLEFVKTIFFKYFNLIIYSLLALSFLLIAIMYYRKTRLHQRPILTGIVTIFVVGLLFYTINFGREYKKAVITQSNTYIMEGPSAGAEVIAIVNKGHRVPVYGMTDVWTKTEWEGQKAYIKADKLKLISFL